MWRENYLMQEVLSKLTKYGNVYLINHKGGSFRSSMKAEFSIQFHELGRPILAIDISDTTMEYIIHKVQNSLEKPKRDTRIPNVYNVIEWISNTYSELYYTYTKSTQARQSKKSNFGSDYRQSDNRRGNRTQWEGAFDDMFRGEFFTDSTTKDFFKQFWEEQGGNPNKRADGSFDFDPDFNTNDEKESRDRFRSFFTEEKEKTNSKQQQREKPTNNTPNDNFFNSRFGASRSVYFAELEISETSDKKAIRAAWIILVKKWHLDTNKHREEEAKTKMARINHAYDVLTK